MVRGNRDTLYSYGVFDLTTPVTITMPDSGERFQSLRAINQDHYIVSNTYGSGSYEFDMESVGTRYLYVAVRTLADPDDPEDMALAHDLQDQVAVEQADPGALELPNWDKDQLEGLRSAILGLTPYTPDSANMFGSEDEVDPVRHLIGTAGGWAGGPNWAAYYVNVTPEDQSGTEALELTVGDVPVEGFWSITVYNADGYMEQNEFGRGYSINDVTATPNQDGTVTIRFGGDPTAENFLNIFEGWNYTLRLYRAREEVLSGEWTFPEPVPAN